MSGQGAPTNQKIQDSPFFGGQQTNYLSGASLSPEAAYYSNMAAINIRLERVELKVESFVQVLPKLDDIHGFTVYAQPHLAKNDDVARAKAEVIAELGPKIDSKLSSNLFLSLSMLIIAMLGILATFAVAPDWVQWARSRIPHPPGFTGQSVAPPPIPAPPQPLEKK